MKMHTPRRYTLTAVLLGLIVGCGDRLADANYRGEPLFEMTGSTRPASEFDGNEYLCNLEIDDCLNQCIPLEPFDDAPLPGLGDDDPGTLCFQACDEQYAICLDNNAGISFTDAYYSNRTGQRIAVLWAQPPPQGDTHQESLSQRGVTTTGFPSRYTFSLYHPPPDSTLFKDNSTAYAYGLMVSYYDVNEDERLDVANEPIIGFNATSAILYTKESITLPGGETYAQGYHLRALIDFCTLEEIFDPSFQAVELANEKDTTLIEISGTTPNIFSGLPDLGCDNDQSEWLSLCSAPAHSARCAGPSISEVYKPICSFCNGQNKLLTSTAELEPTNTDMEDPCAALDTADAMRCESEQQYTECLNQAQDEAERALCEASKNGEGPS
jgi:hypothetical protein